MKKLFCALLLSSCATAPVAAQTPQCGEARAVAQLLLEKYGETPLFAGLVGQGAAAITIFSNEETQTFTIVHITPDGTVCPIADGVGYQVMQNK